MSVLTAKHLADALDEFWNAAIGNARNRQTETAADVASVMAEGIAAVATALRKAVWHPISEAKLDGTAYLVGWRDEHGEWVTRRAWWDASFRSEWDDELGGSEHHGAWTDNAVASFGYEETHSYTPTHFTTLPEGPRS